MSKVTIDVPSDLLHGIQTTDPNKPYDICLHCSFLEDSCDGPNIVAMEYPRWVEWASKLAQHRGLTRAQIADRSGLPKSTIDSALSGRTGDIRHSTLQAITRVIVGGCWGQYPCHLASLLMHSEQLPEDSRLSQLKDALVTAEHRAAEYQTENIDLKLQLKQSEAMHQAEIARIRGEDQREIDWLKERTKVMDGYLSDQSRSIARKERTIAALCVVVALLGVLMIGTLAYDKLHPDVGWLRAESTSHIMYSS